MKGLVLCAACLAMSVWAEDLPRNPFWPQGYEGKRYPISAEPRFKPEPVKEIVPEAPTNDGSPISASNAVAKAKAPEAKPAGPLEDPAWNEAVKALRFGSTLGFSAKGKAKSTILINGRVYSEGDLVSANVGERRWTWRIEALPGNGKIKLKRITYRKIGTKP